MFVYWYLIRFTGESPFSHSALDIKTFAMALLKKDYRDSTKRQMPKKWFDTYSDAEIWMLNSGMATDQKIHKEAGRYFIFVDEERLA